MSYDHIRILNTLFASGVWFEMTLAEVRVYVAICSHWNWNTLVAFPTINTLAEEVRLSRRGVIYAINKLEAKGLIRIVKKGRKNYYQIFDYLFTPINNTTITNSFNTAQDGNEQDYIKQMRKDLLASGRYHI